MKRPWEYKATAGQGNKDKILSLPIFLSFCNSLGRMVEECLKLDF
jgi:hypothetical protein